MLDFYLIKDEQPKPDYPEQINLEFVLGLDIITFNNLVKKGVIETKFDYYSDFRWSSELIKQISIKILNTEKLGTDVTKLDFILKKALKSRSGIIAYCD